MGASIVGGSNSERARMVRDSTTAESFQADSG